MMDSPKHKSRKEVSEKESKRSHRDRDKDDREHHRERNGVERHHHRSSADKKSKDSSHYPVRESTDDRPKRKEEEGERGHKERGHKEKERSKSRVDERVRTRDDREADLDKEYKDRHREKERTREKDREHEDTEREHKEKERESEVREREREREHKEEQEREVKERERERELKEKELERERERERKEERERERERKEERERERERKEKEREREREHKEKEREREDKDRERERERKERARVKVREREDKERERERKERERERERAKREREKEEERSREKEVGRIREKEKRRATSRDYSSDDTDVKGHDKKRRKREDDYKTRDSEKGTKSNKHRDKNEDGDPQKTIDDETTGKKETTWEEDMAEEQKKLDEEMEKRRRRVQEWQELKRKKEEHEMEKHGAASSAEEPKSGKAWTLEGESDDEEPASGGGEDSHMDVDSVAMSTSEKGYAMAVDTETEPVLTISQTEDEGAEDIDPLDAYMNSMVLPEVEKLNDVSVPSVDIMTNSKEKSGKIHEHQKKGSSKSLGRIISGEDSDSDYGNVDNGEDPLEDEDDEEFLKRVKKTKVEKLTIVDHSKIDYPPFRKNFHIEVKEIARMTSEEVSVWRKQLELKIHGKDVPKPVKAWHQTGLSTKILDTIKKFGFERPMPIQAQALPVIMSGRDCIGIAKTGSGKTLAFVLPMLRHIKDQPPLMSGDGPIGLVMAPTRELVQQIHSDIKKFAKVVGLNCVPVYGGSGVAQQISDLKRGTEIVVCTPGRMIDILCTSSGKITNLRRVTYLVMDEADRMFDMGFEPQITRIVQNTRPDRQTVLFSATFPRQVETLARKVLNRPIEIQVGGRSVVNKDIDQLVEVRPENERFLRLLELLGEWYEKGKILIFVHSQEKCDALFKDMLRHGYPCLSLHGAKDQTDRESTITDFKTNVCNLLIATSVAARGLDVKELELVINFDVPNHYEDYVHRVGRTGRAGRKGCAITFIGEEDARYAPDLVKALELSEQVVPDDLKALAEGFSTKVNQGLEKAHGTGYGGSGFKFNEEEDEVRRAAKKAQAKEYGFEEEDKTDSDDEDDAVKKTNDITQTVSVPSSSVPLPVQSTNHLANGLPPGGPVNVATRALLNLKHNLMKIQAETMPEHFEAELEINDFPQNARWKVTHKETLGPISEWTGAAITTRGQYFPPGKIPGPGERKLYLFIEGQSEQYVKKARAELKRVLEDITAQTTSLPGSAQPGRYSVFS